MRVGVQLPLDRRNTDLVEESTRLPECLVTANPLVMDQHVCHLTADGERRIERCRRILEDHRDALTTDSPHLLLWHVEQRRSGKLHLTRDDAPSGWQESHD